MMNNNLESLLSGVRQPSRYGGNEFNVIKKDWDAARLRLVLAFPDLYEIGMSHQGLQILYKLVNAEADLLAERVYAPDLDLEKLLRDQGMPLFSLESRRPLADFDILGITLPYELCYSNILTLLDLAGIPFWSKDRSEAHPLVLGGGPCAFHPEPVADFFDAILLGDGEEALVLMARAVLAAKEAGEGRVGALARLAAIEGVYVPSYFRPRYDAQGNFLGIDPLVPECSRVRRRILADLDAVPIAAPPLVPLTRIVHDRLGLEITRGCTRGCRFCQAGMIYRPVRERTPERVFQMAQDGIAAGGFEELALLSLSTGDYSCLSDLLVRLMDSFAKEHVSVSLPSLRVGTLTPAIMEQIKRVRKTGFTLAPEAGTDRLRRVINKGITEADLLATAEAAFGLGWKIMKLYFMFGLPTETEEDIAAITDLAKKVLRAGKGGGSRVNVSVATFVPKPHTPFEREPQLGIDQGYACFDQVRQGLGKNCTLKRHDPRMSYLEGVFSRGDRRLADLIVTAWERGARLDAWTEYFDLGRWQEAALACGLHLDHYLRRRRLDEPLPWQHLEVNVREGFFAEEYEKGLREEYTPDCRVHGCQHCGVCDLKQLKPIVHAKKVGETAVTAAPLKKDPTDDLGAALPASPRGPNKSLPPVGRFLYRFNYARLGPARLLSHLELLQVFFRVFRRLHLPLNFSQGFNPTPKVSFSPALPLGTESLAEFIILELYEPLRSPAELLVSLNRQLPEGLRVDEAMLVAREPGGSLLSTYRISQLARLPDQGELDRIMAADSLPVVLIRKGARRELDLRPLLYGLCRVDGSEDELELRLAVGPGQPGAKPLEVLAHLLDFEVEELRQARVLKVACQALVASQKE